MDCLIKNGLFMKEDCYQKWAGIRMNQIMTVKQTFMKRTCSKNDYSKSRDFAMILERRPKRTLKGSLKNVNIRNDVYNDFLLN